MMMLLLLLFTAAAVPSQARLIIDTAALPSPLAQLAALRLSLPQEQLAMGVPDSEFLAVLAQALACLDSSQDAAVFDTHLDSTFELAVSVASTVLEGPKDFFLQGLQQQPILIKYPAAIPNLTAAFPPPFNISGLQTLPWLNRTLTIKGFKTFDALNWTKSLVTPQIPLLNSKLILSNNFTQATLQLLNPSTTATKKAP
jgi:hypothetical protein